VLSNASAGSAEERTIAATTITSFEPTHFISHPINGMAQIAPTPKNRSNSPKLLSFNFNLSFTNGTMGAQPDMASPHSRKYILVARLAAFMLNVMLKVIRM
jgi:hypothetical protein